MSNTYHSIRLVADPKRKVLWSVLTEYLQRYIEESSSVLDFGAGYCDFINMIKAKEKIAYDIWDGIQDFANDDVKLIVGSEASLDGLDELEDDSLDVIFASNIFEHFEVEDLSELIQKLKLKLKPKGILIALQPNYHYAYKMYFDDYTHKSIWTHVSLPDYFSGQGFRVIDVQAKFMPLTVKSRLPVSRYLIKLYLISPFKPIAGQMLVVCELEG